MKRFQTHLLALVCLIAITAATAFAAIDKITAFAQKTNAEKTAQVQLRIDETVSLLTGLAQSETILSRQIDFEKKARFLTDLNREKHDYMMLRILDQDMNVYKEGVGLAANLSSRNYLQKLCATGELQVTDAFLAGADGQTVNYTVAMPIRENGKVTGALFAAIYGEEFDRRLADAQAKNVLVGSELQYMSGAGKTAFGLPVAQILEAEKTTSRPVENILLDFRDKISGSFWRFAGTDMQYFVYTPVRHTNWVILTEVSAFPLLGNLLLLYACSLSALAAFYLYLMKRKHTRGAAPSAPPSE